MPTPPLPTEYDPYYDRYIGLVRSGDILSRLRSQGQDTQTLVSGLADTHAFARYAPGKWTVKDVLGHIADTERVMALRLLWAARGDASPLPGFEQDDWVAAADLSDVPLARIADNLAATREATLALAGTVSEKGWQRTATAGGRPISARALLYVIAGHELHHHGVLRDRYLPVLQNG